MDNITAEEWINSIPDLNIRVRVKDEILKSYNKETSEYLKSSLHEKFSSVINIGFSWQGTKEGYGFWNNVRCRYLHLKPKTNGK